METINECLTLTVIYFYMLMCDSTYDANQRDNYIGLCHIFITLGMIILNLLLLLKSMGLVTLPGFYQNCKKLKDGDELEKWLEDKKKKHEADVNNFVQEKIYLESKEYVRLVQWKQKLDKQ